jgi:hypothetical protein
LRGVSKDEATELEDALGFAIAAIATAEKSSERRLLVSALLAGELDAGRALFGRNAIWRAAFSASSLDPGVALLHDNGLARHGLADQALGLFPHRLLGHPSAPVMGTEAAL